MHLLNLVFMIFLLTYIGITIYLANQLEANRVERLPLQGLYAISGQDTQAILLRWMLYGIAMVIVLLGMVLVQMAILSGIGTDTITGLSDTPPEAAITATAGLIGTLITIFCAGSIYTFVRYDAAREWLAQRLNPKAAYNAQSPVHLVALVLMLALIDYAVMTFLLQGGVQGIADGIAQTGVQAADLIFQLVLQLTVTFMGVGLAFRRDLSQTLKRLGVRFPTLQDVVWGIVTGIAFIAVMYTVNLVWYLFVPEEQIAQDTVAMQQLNQSLATLPLAFLVAFTASIGEELWIRGALQPIFGIGLSTAFFASLHTQAGLTPAILLIALLSVGLGILRQKVSTTAAIIAHFVFNFIPLALLALLGGLV